jgi:hypothetical protein
MKRIQTHIQVLDYYYFNNVFVQIHTKESQKLQKVNIRMEASLLRRGLHEVSSEGKVSAQGVMGRAK